MYVFRVYSTKTKQRLNINIIEQEKVKHALSTYHHAHNCIAKTCNEEECVYRTELTMKERKQEAVRRNHGYGHDTSIHRTINPCIRRSRRITYA